MSRYSVTVISRTAERNTFQAVAKCRYAAWLTAAEACGVSAIIIVRPA